VFQVSVQLSADHSHKAECHKCWQAFHISQELSSGRYRMAAKQDCWSGPTHLQIP